MDLLYVCAFLFSSFFEGLPSNITNGVDIKAVSGSGRRDHHDRD